MVEALAIRLRNQVVGELVPTGELRWDAGWQQIAPLNSWALSCSIPFGDARADASAFLGGLLPEGAGLDRLAREAGLARGDLFGLLAEVGADVGGAVTIGEPRPPRDPVLLEEHEVDALLEQARGYLRGAAVGGGGSSAAGIQAKVALTRDADGRWWSGRGSTPSTHILKPVSGEFAGRVRAELLMHRLARAVGLASYDAWIETRGTLTVLVVERFDRSGSIENGLSRVHAEDAAQALGLPWGGDDKYESVNARASLRSIAALLDRDRSVFASGPGDRERLLAMCVLNVVAGNTDAHAKNFTLLHDAADLEAVRLADAYDVVPQAFFVAEPDPLAMRIGGVSSSSLATVRDLVAEAESWGVAASPAEEVVRATLAGLGEAIDAPQVEVEDSKLLRYLRLRVENLAHGDAAWVEALAPGVARY